MCSCLPPTRYGHHEDPSSVTIAEEPADDEKTDSEETELSIPKYRHSPTPARNSRNSSRSSAPCHSRALVPNTPAHPSEEESRSPSSSSTNQSINLSSMCELLRSHKQEIVHRVMQQLNSQSLLLPAVNHPIPQSEPRSPPSLPGTQPPSSNPTLMKIAELESQVAALWAHQERQHPLAQPGTLGTFDSTQSLMPSIGKSASGILDLVETMFPGVERTTLVQIIENKFKPTNIYRLLASEKAWAETHRTISIGGMEFEQAEREGRESQYRMRSFFKAWAVYSRILIKLAPHVLQSKLATSLCIYMMNLNELLEKYT